MRRYPPPWVACRGPTRSERCQWDMCQLLSEWVWRTGILLWRYSTVQLRSRKISMQAPLWLACCVRFWVILLWKHSNNSSHLSHFLTYFVSQTNISYTNHIIPTKLEPKSKDRASFLYCYRVNSYLVSISLLSGYISMSSLS